MFRFRLSVCLKGPEAPLRKFFFDEVYPWDLGRKVQALSELFGADLDTICAVLSPIPTAQEPCREEAVPCGA